MWRDILNILRILHILKKSKKRPKILVLLDIKNILDNSLPASEERVSPKAGFDRLMKELGKIGQVDDVYIFAPLHIASQYQKLFYELGFYTIACPRITNKLGQEVDATDSVMIDFGKKMISQNPNLDYLCVGSGDKDFLPLIRKARQSGLKIITIVGCNIRSLAEEIIPLVDNHPGSKKKMVLLFSPTDRE